MIVTPFLLMGAMAPVSVPAALVQQTVEALAGIALAQLVRPGTPCVLGSFLSATDMKSGSPGVRRTRVRARPLRLRPDRAPARPAVALGRRHAHVEPGRRLPGRVRGDEHAAVGLPRRRERLLAVGRLARRRSRHLVREVRRRLRGARPAAAPVHPGRRRRGEPRLRRACRGRSRRPLLRRRAHARALPRVLLATDDRLDREHRPLDARRLARPRRARERPLEGATRKL